MPGSSALAKAGVAFVALKENIRVDGERDIQTKVMTTLFALFAEVERDLISERTREGLARARSSGRKLGRPERGQATDRGHPMSLRTVRRAVQDLQTAGLEVRHCAFTSTYIFPQRRAK